MSGAKRGDERARVLGFLSKGEATATLAASAGRVLLEGRDRGTIGCSLETIRALCADGLVRRENGRIARTSTDAIMPGPGRIIETMPVDVDGIIRPTSVNAAESPLALLARRRVRDGKPFIDGREFAAGERLRMDYTRGQIMPRLGANWEASVASGRRHGGAGGMVELTEAAIAARRRVEAALDAVGPELSGTLVDVCCFLKGLETVEMERGWAARSAKVVLKAGLAALARHYEPARKEKSGQRMLHWGADDYRPAMR